MTCSKCDGLNDRAGQRYCRPCHAAYQRMYRARRRRAQIAVRQLLEVALSHVKPKIETVSQ